MDDLTPKQQAFVREYLVDLNATQAAIRAGYSERSAAEQGAQLLVVPKVLAAVEAGKLARQERVEVKADYVLRTIIETVERCRQAEPVRDRKGKRVYTETPDGQLVPAFMFDSKGVLKGCELLGRHLSLFNDKLDLTVNDTAQRILEARKRAGGG